MLFFLCTNVLVFAMISLGVWLVRKNGSEKPNCFVTAILIYAVSIFSFCYFYYLFSGNGVRDTFNKFFNSDFRLAVEFLLINVVVGFCWVFIFRLFRIKTFENKQATKKRFTVLNIVFLILGCFLFFVTNWLRSRFPMDETEKVFFTMKNSIAKVESSIYTELGLSILYGVLLGAGIFFAIRFLFLKKNRIIEFLTSKNNKKLFRLTSNALCFIFVLLFFFTSLRYLVDRTNAVELYKLNKFYTASNAKVIDSELYMNEYINPENKVMFPERKRNLIVVLMESMESSYQAIEDGGLMNDNLIPHLSDLARQNVNFSHTEKVGGGIDLSGTSWTVGGMTGKFVGVPFNLAKFTKASDGTPQFLPNAISIHNILHNAGYNQVFCFGSDKHFASRNVLFETHGDVEMHDINYYKQEGRLEKSYNVFWGFEDTKLYKFAKEDLTKLASENKPFSFGLLTVDTHMPYGYLCENCKNEYTSGKNYRMKNAIKCADRMVFDFVSWIQEQDWYENTTIVIMGDHRFMIADKTNFFDLDYKANDAKRRWLNIFINPAPTVEKDMKTIKNRKFSSFDMYPTILASIGCSIEGDRLALGVNLFGKEKTIAEKYDEKKLNIELMTNNHQYRKLMLSNGQN